MELLEAVKSSFPGLNVTEYKEALFKSIDNKRALVIKIENRVVGALIFSSSNNEIKFLAVHPDYRKNGIAKKLIRKLISLFSKETKIRVITYRENDLRGVGARKLYQSIGFNCGELITVFDYPCQEMIYTVK